jgi:hypothetical protein
MRLKFRVMREVLEGLEALSAVFGSNLDEVVV